MQVDLNLVVDVYKIPGSEDGTRTFKVKVWFRTLHHYLNYKFVLFNENTGQYEIYPDSYKDFYTREWEDKFEFSKQTDFYEFLLEEVILAVEEHMDMTIERREK